MECIERWSSARESYTKLRALVPHMETVQGLGLVALFDEQVAAKRRWQEILSSSNNSIRRLLEKHERDRCWRDKKSEQTQRHLTIKSVRRRLVRI